MALLKNTVFQFTYTLAIFSSWIADALGEVGVSDP